MSSSPKKKARAAARKARRAQELARGGEGAAGGKGGAEGLGRFAVVLCGRPNVGKSTLFNRLALKATAIVDRIPGTTRDWKEGDGTLGNLDFVLYDTGGLEETNEDDLLAGPMQEHTARAVQYASVVLFILDGKVGVTEDDKHFAKWLRSVAPTTDVIPVVNKCEAILQLVAGEEEWAALSAECFSLGLGEPIPLSAEHGDGLSGLYEVLEPYAVEAGERDAAAAAAAPPELDSDEEGDADEAVQLAIVGRPNVGKSTLVNCLLGEDRLLTAPIPGVTRESTKVEWEYDGVAVELVDTAGIRRWAARDRSTPLEALSVGHARRALGLAHVVVLVLDAQEGITKWELSLAQQALDEGRGLVVAVNKLDLVENQLEVAHWVQDQLEDIVTDARGVQSCALSAIDGTGVDGLMPLVFDTYLKWNKRVTTGRLNRWFERLCRHHPPPLAYKSIVTRGSKGKPIKVKIPLKLKFLTQINIRPPTFALFANRSEIPDNYRTFLINSIREEFELEGVPIRLLVRAPKNPHVIRARKR